MDDIEWVLHASQLSPRPEKLIHHESAVGIVNGLAVFGPNMGAVLELEVNVIPNVVEKAAENATIDVPEEMVSTEVDRMVQEFEQRLQAQGLNLEMYAQFSGQDESALREQFQVDAGKRVRVNLTLEAIANAENIEVSDEDVQWMG